MIVGWLCMDDGLVLGEEIRFLDDFPLGLLRGSASLMAPANIFYLPLSSVNSGPIVRKPLPAPEKHSTGITWVVIVNTLVHLPAGNFEYNTRIMTALYTYKNKHVHKYTF